MTQARIFSQFRPALIVPVLVVSVLLSACGGSSNSGPVSTSPANTSNQSGGDASVNNAASAATATATMPQTEPIAAVVNNETIPLSTLNAAVERRLAGIRALNDPLPSDMTTFRLTVLDSLIEQMLIEQTAKTQQVMITDEEVEAEIQATINIAGGREKWLAQLQGDAMTEAEFRSGLRSALVTQKMRDIVTKDACVAVEQVHARHILVQDEATALEIKTRLDQGEPFANLAAQYSLDISTKQTGGDLGWFARGQLLQASVEEAAFSLEINTISTPIKSELGYHIVQTLEKVKDRPIDQDTCFRLSEAAFERWLQDLVLKSKIEKYPNGR
ncbi:MAG: peptidylprolyl isomerase [Anaerolineae bacterium]|nr:peptidylprolyl isomerase [Anaerolineae bacterium]